MPKLERVRRLCPAFVCAVLVLAPVLMCRPLFAAPPAAAVRPIPMPARAAESAALSGLFTLGEHGRQTTQQPTTVDGTAGNDRIRVKLQPDGTLAIVINGATFRPQMDEADQLVVDGLAGDDRIVVDGGVDVQVAIDAEAGDDVVTCGSADAYINGGTGRDILEGGDSSDTLYGGPGNDTLIGGAGADYLDGGGGKDTLRGGDDNDMLFGGLGSDRLFGGAGDDLMVGGPGADSFNGGLGIQTTYTDQKDRGVLSNVGKVTFVKGGRNLTSRWITVLGDPAFRLRVFSDLQSLLSVPIGRKLLAEIDSGNHQIQIEESVQANETTIAYSSSAFLNADGTPGVGSGTYISYNAGKTTIGDLGQPWMERPPMVGLYHELVHAMNATHGTMQPDKQGTVPKLELQAIGLPVTGIAWDNDNNPKTPRATGNLPDFTENGVRSFLGLPARTQY